MNTQTDALATVQAQLAALQQQLQQQAPPAAGGWAAQPPQAGALPIQGVAVPVKLQTPGGSIRLYLSLPAECAATQEALMAALEQLHNAGLPLDVYQQKGDGWNRGGGGGWNRGGNSRGRW